MINLLLLIGAATVAYLLTALFEIFNGYLAAKQLRNEEKKRLKNELYRFKLKQLYYYCEAYYIECGYSRRKAQYLAVNAVHDMDFNLLVDEKFKMMKGAKNDVVLRHKGSR